jgi:hypothetical protein
LSYSGRYLEAKSPEALGQRRRSPILMKSELWVLVQVSI